MNQTADEAIARAGKLTATPPKRTPTVKRRGRWLKRGIILVVLAGGVWAGFRYWTRPSSAAMEYKTSPVTRGDITQFVTANGSLTPVQLVEVGSQISGVITEIKADFNSRVK